MTISVSAWDQFPYPQNQRFQGACGDNTQLSQLQSLKMRSLLIEALSI